MEIENWGKVRRGVNQRKGGEGGGLGKEIRGKKGEVKEERKKKKNEGR